MPNVNPTETNLIKTDSIENSQSNNYFDVEILRKQTWEKLASLGTTKNYFKPSYDPSETLLILNKLYQLEQYWAYPGGQVMAQLYYYLESLQYALFFQLSQNVNKQLSNQAYRIQQFIPFKTNLDHLDHPSVQDSSDLQIGDRRQINHKTYFEVLIIHPNPAEY